MYVAWKESFCLNCMLYDLSHEENQRLKNLSVYLTWVINGQNCLLWSISCQVWQNITNFMPQFVRTDYCGNNPQLTYLWGAFIQYFLNHFKIILPSMSMFPTWLRLLVNILVVLPTSPVHATWLTQPTILNFISIMFCKKYGLWKLLFKDFFTLTFKHSPCYCSQTPSVCVLPLTLWCWNFTPSISCIRLGIKMATHYLHVLGQLL